MSLFQCTKCGCLENTAATGGYWVYGLPKDVEESYRKVLNLPDHMPWGKYCSVCNPLWFDARGNYGKGPRPIGYAESNKKDFLQSGNLGVWHGRFERIFLPKGQFYTNNEGNLAHVRTHDTKVDKYKLPEEDRPGHHTTPLE